MPDKTASKLARRRWKKPGEHEKASERMKRQWADMSPEERSREMSKRRRKGIEKARTDPTES